ncbi:Fe-S cluster assembly protein SufD [Stigmatella aurantiaca]|uniref:FeS assembly protein SufD n=1 Tax=Stigmatella aurantiaca (strain DW4/3-1) TaxID=378806 RepID=Q09CC4_STIAD|nr:Fe-S cluster assembly protein SufD [Stigmatella aurantiaca]ADO69575.1 FeS assembly protein SufD [Stigmatella aurantiaca DW4/3-1]EAU69393.1 FeS assembly protein SufD [Stigmatella aurantiaca DW4/3-1]
MSDGLQHYLDVAQRFQAGRGTDPVWLRTLRQEGLERLAQAGFPTTRHEAWKYTDVAPIVSRPFVPAWPGKRVHLEACVEQRALPGPRWVFVDGLLAPELSSLEGLPPGVRVMSLREAVREEGEALEAVLGQRARAEAHPFVALNAALLEEGVFVRVAPGTVAQVPVQLLFLVSGDGAAQVLASPRIVVDVGANAEAALVEFYAGEEDGASFTNAVTEVVLGENARLHHYKLQAETEGAYHLASLHARQARDSRFASHSFALGGALARNEVSSVFGGEGGECQLNGLYVGRGAQHLDHRTDLDHAVPRCTSRELYKGVLDGRSRGTFHGRVLVRPDAQHTDATQSNRNLLLSEEALVDTRPQLEILADDVKCAHGAVVGRLDEQALFYLRSRGIPRPEAEQLLTYAFASEVVGAVALAPLRAQVERLVAERLLGTARREVEA